MPFETVREDQVFLALLGSPLAITIGVSPSRLDARTMEVNIPGLSAAARAIAKDWNDGQRDRQHAEMERAMSKDSDMRSQSYGKRP